MLTNTTLIYVRTNVEWRYSYTTDTKEYNESQPASQARQTLKREKKSAAIVIEQSNNMNFMCKIFGY